ncbi:MAG: Prephenate dehydrogenase [uncultured Gemmatimonadetes bacterium]|uniref:Prephenate dehydrogenase n=1 Tax=uncultured Gemmatimonadota bacterium TaxID=203437 RepID=A0A6J4KD37_9BACT|nr:MAG: Prephenate dehydrogenase [uncultured Gemmatimonadota bacterium]
MKRAVVIGLGLIGGSVARDLAARGVYVLGYDRDPATLAEALRDGGIHEALSDLDADADLVVIAVPVSVAAAVLRGLGPRLRAATLITDAGSTKASIVQAAQEAGLVARFVGSHPLAGDHRSGWSASRAGLFVGARVFLSPTASTAPDALDAAHALWRDLGATTEAVDAAEHDRRLASISHLPQALATALASLLSAQAFGRADLGPGARDMTRLAGSSPEMWTAIAADNAHHLVPAVAALEERLGALRAALARGDEAWLRRFFEEGNRL